MWVSNVVCVAWTWITTAVCLVWDAVTTVVNAVVVVLESILGWILSAIAFVIELIFEIPILGRLIKWIWNFILNIFWTIVSIVDMIAGLIGIRPEKKLRLCTIVLRDESGAPVAPTSYVIDVLQAAVDIWRREANVRIIPLRPFKFDSGFADDEAVDESWVHDGGNGDSDTLTVPCDADGFGRDLVRTGTKLDFLASTNCFFGAWRSVIGYGSPVACFVIQAVPTDTDPTCGGYGCGLWLTDYITVRRQPCSTDGNVNRRVVAHELGHACNLWHLNASSNSDNLMGVPWDSTVPELTQTRMSLWQVLLVRGSKHVTYF